MEMGANLLGTPEVAHLARGEFGQVITMLEPLADKNPNFPAERLRFLCEAYGKVKRYNKLFPCLDRLRRRIAAGDNRPIHPITGKPSKFPERRFDPVEPNLRASAYLELARYDAAIREADRALAATDDIIAAIRAKPKPALDLLSSIDANATAMSYFSITALGVKGLALALSGRRDAALAVARKMEATEIYMADSFTPELRDAALARIYMALRRFPDALKVAARTKEARGWKALVVGLSLDPDVSLFSEIPMLFMQAKATFETGDVKTAKVGFDKLLTLPQLRQSGGIYWQLLYDRGRIARQEGDAKGAIAFFERAIEVIEEQRATINTEANKIGFIGDKQSVYLDLIELLVIQGRVGKAFDYVERAKARALVDLLASKQTFATHASAAAPAAQLLANLRQAESESYVEKEHATTADVTRTRGLRVDAKRRLVSAAPELASLVTVTTPGIKEIQALLPADETLLEYFGAGDAFHAFVVTRADVRAVKLSGKGLANDVAEFRAEIMDPKSNGYRAAGARLYARLIAPVVRLVKGANVTIVPHGALHYLPFNAIPAGKGHLIDYYSIRVLPSASVMKFLRRRAGQQADLLVLGNPDLGNPRFDLPGAEKEARAVAKRFDRAALLVRRQATESAVKANGAQFRYLHFASHGTFDPDAPLASALLLAGDGANDGRLTVGELYDLNLNADLVTLSACETALGKIAGGDDVVGFTRGFLYAGASSIVSTLWKVDDEATARLMQAFYKSLRAGADKRQALRSAQIGVRDGYNAHPLYWAAFQLTGSVR